MKKKGKFDVSEEAKNHTVYNQIFMAQWYILPIGYGSCGFESRPGHKPRKLGRGRSFTCFFVCTSDIA